jgi:hypothetical protein
MNFRRESIKEVGCGDAHRIYPSRDRDMWWRPYEAGDFSTNWAIVRLCYLEPETYAPVEHRLNKKRTEEE